MNVQRENHPQRLDAAETVFFQRELEYVKSQTYDVKHRNLKAFDLLPISTEAGPAVNYIVYRRFTAVALSSFISDYSKALPRSDAYGEEVHVKVHAIGIAYGWSMQEIRASEREGKHLDTRRAAAARRGIDEQMNKIALVGDASVGINGLINYPGITEATLTLSAATGTKTWMNKTADEILADIAIMQAAITEPTYEREQPNTLLVPTHIMKRIANMRIESTDTTLLQFILKNDQYLTTVDTLHELKGAGVGGTDRLLMGTFDDPMLATLEIPQPFEQFEEQKQVFESIINCHARIAGTIIYYPMAFAYADGV